METNSQPHKDTRKVEHIRSNMHNMEYKKELQFHTNNVNPYGLEKSYQENPEEILIKSSQQMQCGKPAS